MMREIKKYYRREAKQNIFTLLHHNYSAILSHFRKISKNNSGSQDSAVTTARIFQEIIQKYRQKIAKE